MKRVKIIRRRDAEDLEFAVNMFILGVTVHEMQFQVSTSDRMAEYAVMIVYEEPEYE